MGTKRTKAREAERTEAIRYLKKMLRPGDTVYTVLTHCARSGMSRSISLCIARKGEIVKIDGWARDALNYRIDNKHGGLIAGGGGMDMGFHLVYSLGHTLWPQGTPKPHGIRNGTADRDGGYALKHRWL
jgi:hypothetical protein